MSDDLGEAKPCWLAFSSWKCTEAEPREELQQESASEVESDASEGRDSEGDTGEAGDDGEGIVVVGVVVVGTSGRRRMPSTTGSLPWTIS